MNGSMLASPHVSQIYDVGLGGSVGCAVRLETRDQLFKANDVVTLSDMQICWKFLLKKNVGSFCSAIATHIFSAKYIRILYIESAKTVNEMTLDELVKLATLWTTGPRRSRVQPRRGRQHSFVETDHEIFSTVILSLPLIQEGQLSVSGEKCAQYWITA